MSSEIDKKMLQVHEILDRTCPPEISFLVMRDPFQFLISVILSAQTTDENVNRVTPELFSIYPDAESLAKADIETVKRIIFKTGFFNTKAKNIIGCAQGIMERFGGQVPTELDDLLTLPGVGRKTANCLRANVLGLPGIVVDTHFSRVINRVFGLGTRNPLIVENYVCAHLADEHWGRFSMTVNLHGRQYCHPSKPECAKCPLRELCEDVAKVSL
ncbi:MAG: endonuclease III [Spirochaetales bacterium]|nr:endonuclease III [Spirochaetales bacterium]